MVLSSLHCSMRTCMLHYFFATCCFMAIILATNGAVTVNAELAQLSYNPANEVVISCTYRRGTKTLLSVQWLNGSPTIVANYDVTFSTLTYSASPEYEPPAYTMSIDNIDSGSNFIISKANITDNGNYTCKVTVHSLESGRMSFEDKADLIIQVAPCIMEVSLNNGVPIQNNSKVTLNRKSVFTAVVPDIYPSVASFNWTVDGTQLLVTAGNVVRLPDAVNVSGLITSGINATLAPMEEYHDKRFGCQALDISGKEMIAFYMDLDVQDGPSGCDAVCIAGIIAAVAALIGIGIGIGIGIRNYTNRDKAKPDKPDTSTTKENTSGDETHRLSKRKLITSGDETHRLSKLITSGDETHRLSKLITS